MTKYNNKSFIEIFSLPPTNEHNPELLNTSLNNLVEALKIEFETLTSGLNILKDEKSIINLLNICKYKSSEYSDDKLEEYLLNLCLTQNDLFTKLNNLLQQYSIEYIENEGRDQRFLILVKIYTDTNPLILLEIILNKNLEKKEDSIMTTFNELKVNYSSLEQQKLLIKLILNKDTNEIITTKMGTFTLLKAIEKYSRDELGKGLLEIVLNTSTQEEAKLKMATFTLLKDNSDYSRDELEKGLLEIVLNTSTQEEAQLKMATFTLLKANSKYSRDDIEKGLLKIVLNTSTQEEAQLKMVTFMINYKSILEPIRDKSFQVILLLNRFISEIILNTITTEDAEIKIQNFWMFNELLFETIERSLIHEKFYTEIMKEVVKATTRYKIELVQEKIQNIVKIVKEYISKISPPE